MCDSCNSGYGRNYGRNYQRSYDRTYGRDYYSSRQYNNYGLGNYSYSNYGNYGNYGNGNGNGNYRFGSGRLGSRYNGFY
jgi:hypothetical protein